MPLNLRLKRLNLRSQLRVIFIFRSFTLFGILFTLGFRKNKCQNSLIHGKQPRGNSKGSCTLCQIFEIWYTQSLVLGIIKVLGNNRKQLVVVLWWPVCYKSNMAIICIGIFIRHKILSITTFCRFQDARNQFLISNLCFKINFKVITYFDMTAQIIQCKVEKQFFIHSK